MLTANEKVAVCFILEVMNLPNHLEGKSFKEIRELYTEDKPHSVDRRGLRMLNLRDELDVLTAAQDKEIKKLQREGQGNADQLEQVKRNVETLFDKIKAIPDNKVESIYEFKELKSLLDLY